jgi:aminopeptidase YwaD
MACLCLLLAGGLRAEPVRPQNDPSETGRSETGPGAARAAAAAAYRRDVFALCGEAMAGRAAGTDGDGLALRYLETRFRALGLQPLAGTALRQEFLVPDPLPADCLPGTALSCAAAGEAPRPLQLGTQWCPFSFAADGALRAEVVFAGHALSLPQLQLDDFAGLDVCGKIVVALRGGPRWGAADAPVHQLMSQLTFACKAANAARRGAVALVIVDRDDSDDRSLDAATVRGVKGSAALPLLWVDRAAAAAWWRGGAAGLARAQRDLDAGRAPAPLLPVDLDVHVLLSRRPARATANVIGLLPGREDGELVVVGANHDHIGRGEFGSLAGAGAIGRVHPGADDNASGVAGVLELARRAGERPRARRGIVFAAFGAEELGQAGSCWFVDQRPPGAPALAGARGAAGGRIAAMIDLHMIGRGRTGCLAAYGTGTGEGLAALVAECAAGRGLSVQSCDRAGWRSDQSSFVRGSVPSLLFTTGMHGQYHRPTDVPELVEVDAALRVVDLVDDVLQALADGPRLGFVEPSRK